MDKSVYTVRLSEAQVILLCNALNEVLHGVEIEEPEFGTRLGASRQDAVSLYQELSQNLQERSD